MTRRPLNDRERASEMVCKLCPKTHQLAVIVHDGEPCSKARPRFGKGRTYTPAATASAEDALARKLRDLPTFPGNVAVVALFFRSNRQRIDTDNLLKLVLDASTKGRMWEDDCQVTALTAVLEHDPERPRTIVAYAHHRSTLTRGDDAKVTCEACGARFFPGGRKRRDTARWCSRECRTKLAELIPCPTCQKPFKRTSGNHKFCSVACRGLATRANRDCERCGARRAKSSSSLCRACWRLVKAETEKPTCNMEGCSVETYARGVCNRHYQRARIQAKKAA